MQLCIEKQWLHTSFLKLKLWLYIFDTKSTYASIVCILHWVQICDSQILINVKYDSIIDLFLLQNQNDINNKPNYFQNSAPICHTTPSLLESSPTISKRLNLNGVCLSATVLQNNNGGDESFYNIEDVLLPEESVRTLTDLQILSLKSNYMQVFPTCVLKLVSLVCLDLSDNNILTIPPEIKKLIK